MVTPPVMWISPGPRMVVSTIIVLLVKALSGGKYRAPIESEGKPARIAAGQTENTAPRR